jgi:1-acyl-sn-glycerol-3-phosphate acyltransferase
MTLLQHIVAGILRAITDSMFRVDDAQLAKVPAHGPLIIVTNHVHIPEIPTLYTRLLPRKVRGMALAERVLGDDLVGWILRLFDIIPVHRGEADLYALRQALETLKEGNIVLLDPEGTRSHDGRLQRGRAGAILLAIRSGAPLLPIVHYGSENYRENLRRLHRTDLHFVVGRPFRIKPGTVKALHAARQQIVDEVMAQMAARLPPEYRGAYTEVKPTEKYLTFDKV